MVLAGFIWGFGHASYPQQPFYIRGVEVGIGGVALGIIMLRFGILPTLVWHYSVDAMYSAMLLVRSESLYFKLSGFGAAGIMVLPVCIALVAYWCRGGFEPETGLLNRDDVAEPGLPRNPPARPPPNPPPHPPPKPRPLPCPTFRSAPRVRWAAAALPRPRTRLPRHPRRPLRRFARLPALPRAGARRRRRLPQDRRASTPPLSSTSPIPPPIGDDDDSLAGKYFLERLPIRAASALFERNRPMQVWMTRYFKSLDQEEITVSVHPETARVTGFGHTIPENRPGADLSPEPAREIAAQFAALHRLGHQRHGPQGIFRRNEEGAPRLFAGMGGPSRRPAQRGRDSLARGDQRLRRPRHFGARLLEAARGLAARPRTGKRPRHRHRVLNIVTLAGLIVYALWLLIQGTRQGIVRWRAAIRLAIPATHPVPHRPAALRRA